MQNKTPIPEYYTRESTFCGCGINDKNPYKDDCYFYHEENQMGAIIKCCSLHGGLGNCPCENCDKHLSRHDAFDIVMEYMKGKERMKENEDNTM